MSVAAVHPEYKIQEAQTRKCRVAIEGEDAVKAAGELILPKLGGMDETDYQAYKARALFFTATYRTVIGLAGTVMRKPLTFEKIKEDDDLILHAGINDEDFNSLAVKSCVETLGVGRVGLLVDAGKASQEPYVAIYTSENIINWRHNDIGGKRILTLVVLKEEYEKQDSTDFFTVEKKVQYRVLSLKKSNAESDVAIPTAIGETGLVYIQEVWREIEVTDDNKDGWEVIETSTPTMAGNRPIDFIPFRIILADPNAEAIGKSPVLDLVNVNMSHYRTSADLEHGRHFTSLPTPWAAGFNVPQGGKLQIGGSTAWLSDEPGAHAGYLEFSGAGLASLESALTEKEKMMAVLGARLLEQQTLDSEAAETVRLRHQGEGSVLSSLALSVEEGLNVVLNWLLLWRSEATEAKVMVNKDFNVISISPLMATALMQAMQAGAISWNTYFYNMKKGELIPDDVTEEDEYERIMNGPNSLGSVAPGKVEEELEEKEDNTDEENELENV